MALTVTRHRPARFVLLLALVAALVLPPQAAAAAVPTGFTARKLTPVLTSAVAMAFLPDGRLLVTERGGRLRVVRGGALLPTPMLTVAVDSSGERGLLGVTADPAFASNGFVYIHYTVPATATAAAHARIERWTVPAGSNVATPASRKRLLDLPALGAGLHNAGALHFGRDGKLYTTVGDNGVPGRAQQLTNPFGKILRIEPATGAPAAGNPFISRSNFWAKRIWAYGLRNPFTFAVSPATGRLHINDVGQDTWEEVNRGVRAGNYGWPVSEGPDNVAGFTAPIDYYGHDLGCSIAGGAFYQAPTRPYPNSYDGDYFFADFCAGTVWAYDVATDTRQTFGTAFGRVVDLAVSPAGALHVLNQDGLWRVDYNG